MQVVSVLQDMRKGEEEGVEKENEISYQCNAVLFLHTNQNMDDNVGHSLLIDVQ